MLGYKWKRVRLSLKAKRDQAQFDKQKAELKQLTELHKGGYINLYFCDESHFGLTPSVCYAWQHKGKPILLPAAKGKILSVLGLMTPDCKLFYKTFEGSVNSDAAIAVMDEFCQSINKRTVVVIDNAPIHKSKKFRAKIDQ